METSKNNKIEWLKHILAITTIILLTAIYILLVKKEIAIALRELGIQVIPNLVAVLIAIITAYYLFTRIGITPYIKLKKSILDGVKDILNLNSFDVQHEVDKEFNLKEKLKDAKEILVVGYSCRYLIAGLKQELVEAIKNKTNLKVIVIGPNSDASKLMRTYLNFQELENDVKDLKFRLGLIKREVNFPKIKKKPGNIELRFVNWIPSCSLIFYIPKENESGIMKLKVYGVDHGVPLVKIRTHKLIYEFKEKELYLDFLKHFWGLWEKGNPEMLN